MPALTLRQPLIPATISQFLPLIDRFIGTTNVVEKDNISFMGTFTYPNLDEMKMTLLQSGEYTVDQVTEIIAGLKTLPEYSE